MKNLIFFSLLMLSISACQKENTTPVIYGCTDPTASNYNSAANTNNGSCTYTGRVMFWYNSSGTNATVNIDGYTGAVTAYYSTYNPTCGDAGCATFTLPTGSYYYSASSSFSSWNGTVTVTKNGCSRVLLN